MSVIHEAIKKAREARLGKKPQPETPGEPQASSDRPRAALTLRSARRAPAWVAWMMLLFLFVEGAMYLRERNLRLHSEDKMRQAYLQLNDVRGEFMQRTDTVRRSASELRELRTRLDQTARAKAELERAKETVEFENLNKEKKVSELKKQMHEVEMGKYRLQGEIYALKAELARMSSPASSDPSSNK